MRTHAILVAHVYFQLLARGVGLVGRLASCVLVVRFAYERNTPVVQSPGVSGSLSDSEVKTHNLV